MRTRFGTIAILTGVVGILLTVSTQASIVYNPTAEFSLTQNQNVNGVWSYGHADKTFTSFGLLPYLEDYPAGTHVGWRLEPNDSANIWVNKSGTTLFGVPNGYLSLHPNYDYTPAVLRWTAPAAGTAVIAGEFLPGHGGTPDVTLRLNLNGTILWTANNSGSFSYTRILNKGDTIDYAVYNAWGSGNTPLKTTIEFSAVPEPTTVVAGALLLLPFGISTMRRLRKS